jgi:hypothetical protein
LDLSRRRPDCLLDEGGERVEVGETPPGRRRGALGGRVADAQRVKGLAPLACKTDRIDAWVLAELSRRELVPAIWLPSLALRAERERARWRLFLVGQAQLADAARPRAAVAFGHTCPVSDVFGAKGRWLLGRLEFPRAVALRRAGRGRVDRRPRPRDRHRRSRAQTVGAPITPRCGC